MRKSLIILILAITWLCSCGPRSNLRIAEVAKNSDGQRSLIHDIEKASGYRYIHTDTTYASSTGKGITIQNSGTRGGGNIDGDRGINAVRGYEDSSGSRYGHAIWWTRIINETSSPLELSINFPADPFIISSPPDSCSFRLFFPSDTMTVDKLSSYNYGITGLRSFFDSNFNKPTGLQTKINPNEDYFFNITMLSQMPNQRDSQRWEGPTRVEVVLEGQNLFYKVTLGSLGTKIIPIGQFVLENSENNSCAAIIN